MRTSAEKYGLPDRQKSFGLMPMMSARKLERQPPDRFSSVHLYTVVGVAPEIQGKDGYFTAKANSVGRLIDAACGNFVVLLEMPNPKPEVSADIRCRANFSGLVEASTNR